MNNNTFTKHKKACMENFMKNLNVQRNNERFCDITLKANDGDTFLVHKIILCAASSFFDALYNSKFPDKESNIIELSKISSDVLKILIEFMYGEEISIQVKEICKVLDGALFLGLYDLVDSCTQVLKKIVNNTNIFELIKYAETYINIHGNKLAKECFEYILDNDIQARIESDFLQLSFDTIKILVSIERNDSYHEENLYLLIKEWISFDIVNREQYVSSLMSGIHFDRISDKFFFLKIFENYDNPLRKNNDFLEKMLKRTNFTLNSKKIESIPLQKDKMKNLNLPSINNNIYAVFENEMILLDHNEMLFSKFITTVDRIDFGYTNFRDQGFFLCGGKINGNSDLNSCKYFSFHMNKFYELPSMSYAKSNHRAVTLNDQIYVCGGLNSSSVEIFDLNMICWRYGHSLKTCMSNFGLCTLNGCIYASGYNYLERFDPRESRWTTLCDNETKSQYRVILSYKNFIYKFDDYGGHKFDIRENKWIKNAVKCNDIYDKYACIVDNEIYAIRAEVNCHKLLRLNCENDSIIGTYELPIMCLQYALFSM